MGKKSYILYFTQTYLLTLQPTTNVMIQRYNKILILLLVVFAVSMLCAANKGGCN